LETFELATTVAWLVTSKASPVLIDSSEPAGVWSMAF
jgi:hypothetical protein